MELVDYVPPEKRRVPEAWHALVPISSFAASGAQLTRQDDRSLLASGDNPSTETYTVVYRTELEDISGLRLELLPDASLPAQGPGRADNGNIVITDLNVTTAPHGDPGAATKLKFSRAAATFTQSGFAAENVIDDDPKSGWAIARKDGSVYVVPEHDGRRAHHVSFDLAAPISGSRNGILITATIAQHGVAGHNAGRSALWRAGVNA